MGTTQSRQILAEIKEGRSYLNNSFAPVARQSLVVAAQWVWRGINEVWHCLFYANVVRKVGPDTQGVVVRNSLDELRYRY